MADPRKKTDARIEQEAADWFALLQGGSATPEDRQAFDAWRSGDERQAAAYDDLLSLWEDAGELHDLREFALNTDFSRRDPPGVAQIFSTLGHAFAPRALAFSVLAMAALVVGVGVFLRPAAFLPGHYATTTAETRELHLADGSKVEIGPKSRIEVAYSTKERRVRLHHGEAFFDVSPIDRRAFVVASGDAEVRVVGTRFNVRQGPSGVTVAVAEGEVEIRRTGNAAADPTPLPARRIVAGQQVAAPAAGSSLGEITETPVENVGAWRTGHIKFNRATLDEVIADANRYSRTPIVIADDSLRDLTLVAAFRADQVDAMIDGLPEILPLDVDRSGKGRVILRAADRTP